MFTMTVLCPNPHDVYGPSDEWFLAQKRPWYIPFNIEVVRWVYNKSQVRQAERPKVLDIIVLLASWIVLWPIMVVWAATCWIIFAIKNIRKK